MKREEQYQIDLRERLLEFAVESMVFIGTIPKKNEFDVFRHQFSKSSTSIGANYEESKFFIKRVYTENSYVLNLYEIAFNIRIIR